MARRRRAPVVGLTICCVAVLLNSVAGGLRRELSLSFTNEAQAGSALPTNDSFVFDGATSDIARQLYLRHSAGESIDQVIPNSIPTTVTDRLTALNVTYDDLPGLLQRALLWDSGYAITPENDAVQIWTLGGRSMSNLAVSKLEFDTTSCIAMNCTQPDDSDYYTNKFCTGTQMLTSAKCLINDFDSDWSSHLSMWSNGGDSDMIPEIRAMTHGWRDSYTNQSYLVYAVHTMSADSEPAYGTCNTGGYGSLVVPCYPMSNTSADVVAVMAEPYTLVSDSNLVGKRIPWERIEFCRLLSRGAFGELWACRYAGKKVAVKRLLQSKKPTFLETQSFTDEIQLTASLNHPNIVRFVGVAWSSLENLAMVEEYLPRGDLQRYLRKNGDLMSWACDKIYMAIGVAKGIEYLHSREVIHRDIKARNVLLTKRLQPKLIDFGTSRLWAPSDMSAGVGTPFWTAPEVLESTEYTEKADIYSFGVLLSELDTCEAPYHDMLGQNGMKMKPFHILKQVVDGLLTPSFTAGCPKRIRRVANACFQRDPKLRPSASDLIEQLQG
ncbi:hypothetical protein BBJ29_006554 [Phytophthora kernoviae]|uniref:Protein kinase domain-containing protein n=1 Tax=Phytophthora kernoviae TaxID=325452 RepID=A0A3F2RF57_9STRA|nr:hypothetical protein BBP00_00008673 [Phytophthora kernoviae]RLN61804.1 hypothetical protein BBJ29_006554 [Phytophthora kernoviae]